MYRIIVGNNNAGSAPSIRINFMGIGIDNTANFSSESVDDGSKIAVKYNFPSTYARWTGFGSPLG
jgi:hypothetical protein